MPFSITELLFYTGTFCGIYFAIFTFITFFENQHKEPQKTSLSLPGVSFLVPCYNEEKSVEKTLKSILELDYPKEKVEILVIDDGSTDRTYEIAQRVAREHKRVRVLKKENGGKWSALNLGLSRAKFSFVATLDADSRIEKQSLKKAMRYFIDPQVMAVISTVKIEKPKNILESIQYIEFLIVYFLRKVFSFLDAINVTPGPLSIIRKEVFQKIGPYREGYKAEDMEIAFRMQQHYMKIVHASDAIAYTKPCHTFKALLKQRTRWKRAFLLNLRDYPELLNLKKHGNLAFVFLYTLLGNFISVVLTFFALWHLGEKLEEKVKNLFLINFDFSYYFSLEANISSFLKNFHLTPLIVLSFISLTILLSYIFFSKKVCPDDTKVKKGTLFYILFYALLNTVWWVWAISSIFFKKDVPWR